MNEAVCAFCGQPVDVSASGDGLLLEISRRDQEAIQQVYAHLTCLQGRLHESIPFEPTVFGDDLDD
jgi:hypothetical protein